MSGRPQWDSPFYDRLRTFLNATGDESARGKALVSASLIEEMLKEILRSFFLNEAVSKKLYEGPNAPLGSLSAKTDLARSLALITLQEYKDIECIRKIRNEFAHSIVCSFDDPKIANLTKNLKTGLQIIDKLPDGHQSKIEKPDSRFGMVSVSLVSSLYNRTHYVSRCKIKDTPWPL